jgi:hypothetical protein
MENKQCILVSNFRGERSHINVLPKRNLLEISQKINWEKLIKDCWYKFIEWLYKNRSFSKVFAYLNPQNAQIRIIDSSVIQDTDKNIFIEIYMIDYNEIRNLQGSTILQSCLYIDKFIEKKIKEGYIDECRQRLKEEIERFFS